MDVHEGRLMLDEHGRVLDGDGTSDLDAAPSTDLLSIGDGRTRSDLAMWAAQRPVAAAALAGTLALLVIASLVAVLAPRPGPSVAIEPPGTEVPRPWPELTAYYVITTDQPVRAVALAGPMVGRSTAQIGSGGVLQVDAVPECADPTSLDARGPAAYAVELVGPEGAFTAPLPLDAFDWGTQLRRACWLQRSADGLAVEALAVRADAQERWLGLELTIGSTVGRDVQVSSVEFVDRVRGGAQQVVLAEGAVGTVLVRMPLSPCSSGSSGLRQSVPWRVSLAVGPPGAPPLAEVAVDVSREQRAQVARAVLDRCPARL